MNDHKKGVLLVLCAVLIFSTLGVFSRLTTLPTSLFIFYYTGVGSLLYVSYFAYKKRLSALILEKDKRLIIASAVLVLITIATYLESVRLTTLSNAVILHYIAPIVAVFFAIWFLKEKLVRTSAIAIIISFIGLVVLMSNEINIDTNATGLWYALISGLAYGILIVINKRIVTTNDYGVVMFYQIFISFIITSPFFFLYRIMPQPIDIAVIFGYAFIILVLASLLYLKGIQFIRAQDIGIISYLEPLGVVMIGIFFYSEIPTIRTLIGGILILYAGYMVVKYESERNNH